MGINATGTLVYWGVVFGVSAAIVFYFNSDYNSETPQSSGLTSLFSSGHDGTPYGRMKQWLDALLQEWKRILDAMAGLLPLVLANVLKSMNGGILYAFRGLYLAVIYFTVHLCEFLGFQMLQEILMSDTLDTIIKFSIFNGFAITLLIIEVYVMLIVMNERGKRSEAQDSSEMASEEMQDAQEGRRATRDTRSTKSHVSTPPSSQYLPDQETVGEEDVQDEQRREEGRGESMNAEAAAPKGAMQPPPQDQGKSLELWKPEEDKDEDEGNEQNEDDDDMDLKTVAMFAYIADCEAYEEDDLRRQNGELRKQIEEGRDAFKDIDKEKEDEISRLTQGMKKMLKRVKKESQFANYALDTLKAEKDVINEELQRLLALEPEELAKIDTADLFKDLSGKVSKSSKT